MLHLLQAFAGPGRTVVSFAPTYSMYPEYARDTHSDWVAGRRRDDFSLDPEHTAGLIEELQPAVVLLASPNNPTGTALPIDLVEHVCAVAPGMVVVDEAYAEVPPVRRAECAPPPGRAAKARGDSDDEQGVRIRRRPRRLPGSGAGCRGRSSHRPIARTICRR